MLGWSFSFVSQFLAALRRLPFAQLLMSACGFAPVLEFASARLIKATLDTGAYRCCTSARRIVGILSIYCGANPDMVQCDLEEVDKALISWKDSS